APLWTTSREGSSSAPVPRRAAEVKLEREHLVVSGKRFFLRGIRHTGTPLKTLRDAGFNTVWFDEATPAATVEEAVNLGLWIVPMLTPTDKGVATGSKRGVVEGQLTSTELMSRKLARFLDQDAVLCLDLGGGLAAEQFPAVARTAQAVRNVDP